MMTGCVLVSVRVSGVDVEAVEIEVSAGFPCVLGGVVDVGEVLVPVRVGILPRSGVIRGGNVPMDMIGLSFDVTA